MLLYFISQLMKYMTEKRLDGFDLVREHPSGTFCSGAEMVH